MRWRARVEPPEGTWGRAFAILPRVIDGQWVWLEWFEYRSVGGNWAGESYEYRVI